MDVVQRKAADVAETPNGHLPSSLHGAPSAQGVSPEAEEDPLLLHPHTNVVAAQPPPLHRSKAGGHDHGVRTL